MQDCSSHTNVRPKKGDRTFKLLMAGCLSELLFLGLVAGAWAEQASQPKRTSELPGGVFSMRGPEDDFQEAPELDLPFVAGLSARIAWDRAEPKQGQYDWTLLDRARDLARAKKKWLMIRVVAGMHSPDWVYELEGVRSVTFTKDDLRWLRVAQARMPVPWDEPFLQAWETYLKALGRKIQDWPEVYCVQMAGGGFIGEMHLVKSERTLKQWKEAGASEEKVNAMWQRIITTYDNTMPAHLGISLNLATPLPGYQSGTVVREWASNRYPGRVWFQQNGLTGLTQQRRFIEVLSKESATTTVGLQMGGRGNRGAVNWPEAFRRAIESKCSYLEIYDADVLDPTHKDDLEFLAKGLKENHESKGKEKQGK